MQSRGDGRHGGFGYDRGGRHDRGRGGFGVGRGGFGGGRSGFGGGRDGFDRNRAGAGNTRDGWGGQRDEAADGRGRANIWKRKEETGGPSVDQIVTGEAGVTEKQSKEQEMENSKWEGNEDKQSTQGQWGKGEGESSTKDMAVQNRGGGNDLSQTSQNPIRSVDPEQKLPCENCGMFNHSTRECRRNVCEICGFNNHSTYNCKRCLPWNLGPELCAAQVEDQSFFFIDECIDPRVVKEKASTAVISVKQGSVNAKQIELEFMNLIGADTWKWKVRPVAEGKFLWRFPSVKMVTEWCRLKHLTMRSGAMTQIDQWSPAAEAKGVLQTAWFRVSCIPNDQRSMRTLAKIGGLVGKVLEIDEGTRYRYDYVRMRIACRDIARVPRTAEATLGLYIIDFKFEREIPEEKSERILKSGIKITDDAAPPAKKSRAELPFINSDSGNENANEEVNDRKNGDADLGKNVQCY